MKLNDKKISTAIWVGYGAFLLFWVVRLWGQMPALMDTLEYVFPEKWFNVESFQKGLIPLWNPYIACGTPHVANFQSAAFYPFFWIWNLTGLTNWIFVMVFAHALLAAVGFYFWMRSFKLDKGLAALCAITFSGSAYLTYLWGFPTHLASLAWIPWIFWITHELLERFSVGKWLVLAGFWALQILAGYPIFTFYAFVFWLVFLTTQLGFKGKLWVRFLGAWGFAILITACQWLPFIDLLGYMHRESWGENLYNLKWSEYLTLLAPDILGIPGSADYKGDYPNYIFGNFYLGLVPLFLLVWSFREQKGKLNFWQKSVLFWFLFPLGSHFLLWAVFPASLWDKLEVSKASFLFVFCAITVLGLYLNQPSPKNSKKSWIQKAAWVFIALWILDMVLVPFRIIHLVPDPYQNNEVKTFAAKIKQMTGEGRLLSLREEDQIYSSSVTDANGSFQQTAERLTQNTNVVWGIKSAQGHLTTVVDGFQNFSQYLREGFPYDGRVLDAAGVNTILTPKPLSAFKFQTLEQDAGLTLVHNAGAMPTAWQTEKEKFFGSRAESFGALLNPKTFLEDETDFDLQPNGQITYLAPTNQYETPVANSPCEFQFAVSAGGSKYFILDQCFAPGWHAWVDGKPTPVLRAEGFLMAVALGAPALSPQGEGHRLVVPNLSSSRDRKQEFGMAGSHVIAFQYSPLSFRLGLFITLIALACFIMIFSKTFTTETRRHRERH